MEIISSAENPSLKHCSKLKEAKYRREYGEYIVEGDVMLKAALDCGLRPKAVYIRESDAQRYMLATMLDTARIVVDRVFPKLTDTVQPKGIVSVFEIPDLMPKQPQGNFLILDRIRDPGNLGTIIRTAAAANYREIFLIDCVDTYNAKVIRSTMSGLYYVSCYQATEDSIASFLPRASTLIAADMGGESVFSFQPRSQQLGIIIGNEAHGVSDALKNLADNIVSIPMHDVESLNAGVAAGIMMYAMNHRMEE